jgi:tRNA(Ile)-lysidine synthase
MPARGVVDEVARQVRRWHGERMIVAVSGGGDSLGLLRALETLRADLGLELSVAHLNHGVRGEEAEADARFVASLAGRLGLPFDLGCWTPHRSGHFEADARRARYAWLEQVARNRGARVVAVGHTRDDQAETILHRILRGTGLRGLSGIPAERRLSADVRLIRPLLDVSRAEIRAYLDSLGQDFREDASNADLGHVRSRLRYDLLPRLASEYNPRVVETLVRLGHLAGASERALRHRLAVIERDATRSRGTDRVELDRAELDCLESNDRVELLRRVWRRQGWAQAAMSAARWTRLATLTRRETGQWDVGAGVTLRVASTTITLMTRPRPPSPALPVPLPVPGSAAWPGGQLTASLDPDLTADEHVDLDRLELPLVVRAPQPGDRFDPLGLEGRTQSLNDFFRGRGVAQETRGAVPLICDGQGIVWVVGHRLAHRVRLTVNTRSVVGLRWEPFFSRVANSTGALGDC